MSSGTFWLIYLGVGLLVGQLILRARRVQMRAEIPEGWPENARAALTIFRERHGHQTDTVLVLFGFGVLSMLVWPIYLLAMWAGRPHAIRQGLTGRLGKPSKRWTSPPVGRPTGPESLPIERDW